MWSFINNINNLMRSTYAHLHQSNTSMYTVKYSKNASERYQNRCRERYKPVPARGTSVQRLSVVPDWPHPGLTTTAA